MLRSVLQAAADVLAYPDYKKDDSVPAATVSVTEILETPSEELTDPVTEIYKPEAEESRESVTEICEPELESTQDQDSTASLPSYDLTTTHIKSSPYDDPVNFLSLQDLSPQERLLAIAMTEFNSTRPDYATAPYMESFNWPAVMSTLRQLCKREGITFQREEFYLVIFRSKLHPTTDLIRLGELDKNSHEEACASGGLLHYWFGSCNDEMRNLATCIWRNRGDAQAGGRGPEHAKAMRAAKEMYEAIEFHRHAFVVGDGAESWSLEEYKG